ncbi:MAG: GNAT family N-acetyltransferase [Desulfobacteraceae bacterium]|nr:MAG: GNAT family N-acetyltransferase [Desulfobacteraceae bacterium]
MEKQLETSTLIVPNDLTYLAAIQAYTGEVAKAMGFQKVDIQMTLLALEEAVANVVEHAFEPDEKVTFQITLEPLTSGLKIIIKDKGLPFAPNLVPEYTAPTDLDDPIAGGLGSFLMKKGVDEISFHNLGREGKELHLIKNLPDKNIVEYRDTADLALYSKPPAEKIVPTEKKDFMVRLMEPSESFEVSRLFYRAYGYSYGIDSIYYPDRFERLHLDGSIISVVTVAADKKIVGHFALVKDKPDSKIAEAAMAVVQPAFRGQGCQNAMMDYLMQEARKAGLIGTFSKAVTSHIYAQKVGEKAGFKRTAIVAGLIPADRSFKGIQSQLSQRESVAYGYFKLANPAGVVIYPPPHHKIFIQNIYENIGLERIYGDTGTQISADHKDKNGAAISTTVIQTYNRAIIEVGNYGKDVVSEVRAKLKELCQKKIDQILLYLNLEDPQTASLCAEFEKMGFFMAGILPFAHDGDLLMLQYLNNVSIDYTKIQVASEAGRAILNYVKAHDPNAG